jgi:2-polyprenyl-3-methyl-5-hydroxy-6-metoxy-1,4-benzoquinol methylase
MYGLLDRALKTVMDRGTLRVTGPDGRTRDYGDGTGTPVNIHISTPLAAAKVAADADLYLGECYMEGSLDVSEGTTIYDALAILMENGQIHRLPKVAKAAYAVRKALKRVDQYNPVGKAKSNVAHHYDLSGALYDLFLDRDRQYSCAYFETDDGSLEDAQLAKKRHLAAKLNIKPGMKVLDIGSGWGGLGLYIAEICGAEVTGVTLSEEQFSLSNERARQRGVSDQVQFHLKDYRHLDQKFDRIVSVGMFEHVGVGHFKEFLHQGEQPPQERRRGGAPFHQPLRRARRHLGLDQEIHLSRRLHSGSLGSAAAHREGGALCHRRRDPQAALCQDAARMGQPLRQPPRPRHGALRRALLPHVGVLPRGVGMRLPLRRHEQFPDPVRQGPACAASDAELHRRGGRAPAGHRLEAAAPQVGFGVD